MWAQAPGSTDSGTGHAVVPPMEAQDNGGAMPNTYGEVTGESCIATSPRYITSHPRLAHMLVCRTILGSLNVSRSCSHTVASPAMLPATNVAKGRFCLERPIDLRQIYYERSIVTMSSVSCQR